MAQGGNGGGPAKGVNKILGNWKDEILIGTDEVDVISGRGGNDVLIGGLSGDTLDGGDGTDTASYAGSAAGVSIDLAAGTASGGDAEGDTLISIENLEGSAFADTLSGDDGANALSSGDGDDVLFGANGDDVLTGGTGNDEFVFHVADPLLGEVPDGDDVITDFQAGVDKIRFTSPFFDVLAGAVQVGGDVVITYGAGSTITLLNTQLGALSLSDFVFEGQNLIIGTSFGETLIGTGGSDIIQGLGGDDNIDGAGGDDLLEGNAGDDIILGGAGDDTILGGDGNDMLRGDSGADLLDGGDGNDTVFYTNSSAGVNVDLATGTASGGDAEGDTLTAIETVFGSNHADSLTGDGGANVLIGLDGDDTLSGGGGDDTFLGGAGADDLQGGDGSDTASYISSTTGVSIDLGTGIGLGGDAVGDTLTGIENLVGSNHADFLTGDAGDNVLDGQGGNDTIAGGDGNDTLSAFAGNNTLDGGAGDDTLAVNGNNFDTLTGGTGADTFSLIPQAPVAVPNPPPPPIVATTTITDFEPGIDRIAFATPFDVLAAAQQLGNDVSIEFATGLTVLLLNTQLADLSADDFVFGNQIVGTAGADTLVGTQQNDNISGLGGDDTLIGNGGNDVLLGGDGNDTLVGALGDDTLDGGAGDDVLSFGTVGTDQGTGGAGADTFSFILTFGVIDDQNPGPANVTTITDFEIGVDVIEFSDPFDPLAAAQQIGNDVLIEYSAERGVLLLNTLLGDLSASDFVFAPPSPILGTDGADTIIGSDLADVIDGLGGDDVLSAKGGDDTVIGGSGNDTLFGGDGNDTLLGGDGDDFLIGRAGDETLTGGAGADTFGFRIPPLSPVIATLDGLGTDTITDFEIGIDTIRIGWTPFDVLSLAVQSGNDVQIDYGVGSTIILQNTNLGALSASDFVFDSTSVDDPGFL